MPKFSSKGFKGKGKDKGAGKGEEGKGVSAMWGYYLTILGRVGREDAVARIQFEGLGISTYLFFEEPSCEF